jgi:hypothetical protein
MAAAAMAAQMRAGQEKKKADPPKLSPAEAIAEAVILFGYGSRETLERVRTAIQEEGSIRLATDQGEIKGRYMLRSIRREKSWQDLLRLDLELEPPESARSAGITESVKFSIAFNGASVWAAQNNRYVTPRPEVEAAFLAQLTRDYTALLRYKEDGSKLELIGPETVAGIDTHVLELTNPRGEKTRYWISSRTYRILHLEYELKLEADKPATKFRTSFFYAPLRIVQNTLVPARRVTYQDGKFVQEMILTNAIYSAKLDPEIFQYAQ